MKAKHIITTCGIILGGLAVAQGASAVVKYQDSANVQFTFNPTLSLTLSGDSTNFTINDLAPGAQSTSNTVTANVATNNGSGYILSATVGGANTSLTRDGGGTFDMISADGDLSAGKWGLSVNNGVSYLALDTTNAKTLVESSELSGTVPVIIGAYAGATQAAGAYTNSINFAVTTRVSTYTITAAAGTGVTTATIDGGASKVMSPDGTATLAATCESGKTLNRWEVTGIGNVSGSTFTAGYGAATVTAYCN